MSRSVWAIAAFGFVAGVALAFIVPGIILETRNPLPSAPQLASAPATAVQAARSPDPAARAQPIDSYPDARRAIIRTLKDPDSARFGRIFEGREVVGKTTICGEVNAKNGFGGYTGMTPFVYFPDNDRAELITNPVTSQMTREGIDAYFKDCRTS